MSINTQTDLAFPDRAVLFFACTWNARSVWEPNSSELRNGYFVQYYIVEAGS